MLHTCYRHTKREDDHLVCIVCGRINPPTPQKLPKDMKTDDYLHCITDSRCPGAELPPVSDEMRKMVDKPPY